MPPVCASKKKSEVSFVCFFVHPRLFVIDSSIRFFAFGSCLSFFFLFLLSSTMVVFFRFVVFRFYLVGRGWCISIFLQYDRALVHGSCACGIPHMESVLHCLLPLPRFYAGFFVRLQTYIFAFNLL